MLIAALKNRALRTAVLACCLLLAMLTGAHAQDAKPAQATEIAGYDVTIDAPQPLKTLLENNLDLMRWRSNQHIDATQLRRLVRAAPDQIKTLVATEGYYSPQVEATLHVADSPNPVKAKPVVEVHVVPGQPVLVGDVDIEIVSGDSDTSLAAATTPEALDAEHLRASWLLKPGRIFRQADWEAAKFQLLRQAVLTRTPKARWADTSAIVDPESRVAKLKLILDPGPSVKFGAVQIEGLQRYPASIIDNLTQIKPGDWYSESALLDLQSRLQDTGYFSNVEISTDLDAADHDLPITVRVIENKRKKAAIGLGYSTNTGNRAQVTYDDLYLYGLRFKSDITVETKKQAAHGNVFFPITAAGDNDSIGTSFERKDIEGVVTSVASLAVKRSWGPPALERSVTIEMLHETKTLQGEASSVTRSVPATYGLTMRRTDDLLFPTSGYVLNLQAGGAVLPILTDRLFLRGAAKLAYFFPLGKDDQLILRAELGAVLAKDRQGIPDSYLFRAGGDQSVRGYAYQSLGVSEGDATVGGRFLATGSVEAQHWFLPNWGAAVFYDVGNAADSIPTLHPKSGYGVGARWKSLVGPINLDVAYGHAVQEYRLHFSLGFTF
ncbi:MAG: autotransporter assembly complex family protein [Pseudomonadota bacterium]